MAAALMLASTAGDVAVLITAACAGIGVLVASVVSLIAAWSLAFEKRANAEFRLALASQLDDVHGDVKQAVQELKTLNGSTVGEITDQNETRRIQAIPEGDRTAKEAAHVEVIPPLAPAPAQRRSRAKKAGPK